MTQFLNPSFISKKFLQEAPYAKSHGVIHEKGYLGTSILYFALAYLLPARTAVVLGSGAGFVPRLVRQAQREIPDEKYIKQSRCVLIDADQEIAGFGKPLYHNDSDHFFRIEYGDVEIWRTTTDDAYSKMKKEKIRIDFLHIDADHTFFQSFTDFENYLTLMNDDFVITLHDTALNHYELAYDGCVPRTIATLRRLMRKGEKYEHLEMINFNQRYKNEKSYFGKEMSCCGTAIIKPKALSFWDHELFEL